MRRAAPAALAFAWIGAWGLGASAQQATTSGSSGDVSGQLQEMKQMLQGQQKQIQDMRVELDQRDQTIEQMQRKLDETRMAVSDTRSAAPPVGAPGPQGESKDSFHLTPGGFLESTAIFRSRNENSDVGSTYGNIPFDGTANSDLTEFRGTARQSRLSLLAEGKTDWADLSGYYEMDFLGAAPTANEQESNSFQIRQRQLWAQIALQNGFSILGGQAWSLMTTDRAGIAPRRELVPLTIDAQYVVGYNWARQWQTRLTKNFGDKVWLSFALENPETILSVTNPPANVFGFNTSANATSPGSQFTLNNTPGAQGISTDVAPDLTGKVAWEPGFGHYELKLLGRFFRDRYNENNNVAFGGGVGAAAILPVHEKVDVILEALGGRGIGRYASGLGPDVTVKPNGDVVPVTAVDVMGGVEAHPLPKLDLYAYAGMEWYDKTDYKNAAGQGVGYGSPLIDLSGCTTQAATPCSAQTRLLWQIQPGFWYRFYRGPAGTLQAGLSYSFTHRTAWEGLHGVQPEATQNIIMSSLRYYLP
jgi:hypothetical protein